MKATRALHQLGQRIWLDNITRGLLTSGTLARYIADYAVTGLTSNPTIFDKAIRDTSFYDDAIHEKAGAGKTGEALFFELALEDLTRAADLFRPAHDASGGIDGWVSLEVSPLLADDTAGTIDAAAGLHRRAQRPNLFIKIPGTEAGVRAIEETIFAGVPVNVTLLFSCEQYLAAAKPTCAASSGASPPGSTRRCSRWRRYLSAAGTPRCRTRCRCRCATGSASRSRNACYRAYRELLQSPRWRKLADRWRPGAAIALGQYRHQGSEGPGHTLRGSARGARHDQYHARADTACVRRSWKVER